MHMRRLIVLLLLCAVPLLHSGGGGNGKFTCPSSGIAVLAPSSIFAASVTVQTLIGNSSTVQVGIGTITSSTGITLFPGDGYTWAPRDGTAAYDLNQISFACAASGDGGTYTYAQ
jgi:hypothetical protein